MLASLPDGCVIWYLGRWFLIDSLPLFPRVLAKTQPAAVSIEGIQENPHRLGSMLFPWALLRSFLSVAGPMLARWSELGLVIMLSQMTALLVALASAASGHSAVT